MQFFVIMKSDVATGEYDSLKHICSSTSSRTTVRVRFSGEEHATIYIKELAICEVMTGKENPKLIG
jgi:hypothetical protein